MRSRRTAREINECVYVMDNLPNNKYYNQLYHVFMVHVYAWFRTVI